MKKFKTKDAEITFNELKEIEWDSVWLKEIYPERFGSKKSVEWWKKEINK